MAGLTIFSSKPFSCAMNSKVFPGIAHGAGFEHCRGGVPFREQFFVAGSACAHAIKLFEHAVEVVRTAPLRVHTRGSKLI